MRWGTPSEYAAIYKRALTNEYRWDLERWMRKENPELWKRVEAELARKAKNQPVAREAFSWNQDVDSGDA